MQTDELKPPLPADQLRAIGWEIPTKINDLTFLKVNQDYPPTPTENSEHFHTNNKTSSFEKKHVFKKKNIHQVIQAVTFLSPNVGGHLTIWVFPKIVVPQNGWRK